MKKKGALLTILSLAMATSVAAAVSASPSTAENNTYTSEASGVVANQSVETTNNKSSDEGIFTPQTVGNNFHFTAGGSATATNSFVVPINYGHVKLYMKNYASAAVTVSVTHIESGLVYINNQSIPANGTLDWRSYDKGFPQGMRSGNYSIQWRSATANVNAEVWGACSNNPTDF